MTNCSSRKRDEHIEELLLKDDEAVRDEWLWCLHCCRFFQAKHLHVDFLGNRQGCPFCGAAGLFVDIFRWNTFRENNGRWPRSTAQLRVGMRTR